ALAHDVEAHRTVGQLGGDVEGVAALVEHVEVLGEGLPPTPRHPDAEGRAGNILDALHQVDQGVVVGRPDWREADPAVAHHDGRDPVRGRRLEDLVPGDP